MATGILQKAKGNPLVLGATKTYRGYNFAFGSEADSIVLNLYRHEAKEAQYRIVLDEEYRMGNVFAIELWGIDFSSYEYLYEVEGVLCTDPYTRYITNGVDFGEFDSEMTYRSGIVCEEFDWEDDRKPLIPYDDMILYKLHTRGFTRHISSKVKHKGTFSGIIEKIPYLKEIGINAVVIMPPYEFFEYSKKNNKDAFSNKDIKKINYWGYTDGLYFAPKYAYSINCKKRDYTVEFKKLVKEMHSNGIEVIVELYFAQEVPTSVIDDCIRNWAIEYRVDGINICCARNLCDILSSDPVLADTKLLCNYWESGKKGRTKNLANINDGFMINARRFLKGDEDMLRAFMTSVKSNPSNAANINYLTTHNGFTLSDLVSYDRKHNEANGENNTDGTDYNYSWNCGIEGPTRKKKIMQKRIGQIKSAVLLLLLAQSAPLIMAGDEFLNSQEGNNNPYCQDNEITWLNWKKTTAGNTILQFFKEAVSFRKQNKILHMAEELKGIDYKSIGFPDISFHSENAWYAPMESYNRHIGVLYCGSYADKKSLVYVAYNMHWEPHELALPNIPGQSKWKLALGTEDEKPELTDDKARKLSIGARSVMVLVTDIP